MLIVVAWTEMTGAEPVPGETEWRDGCYRQVYRTVPQGMAATWTLAGDAADLESAERYVRNMRQAPSHAEPTADGWGIVIVNPAGDSQKAAKAAAMAARRAA